MTIEYTDAAPGRRSSHKRLREEKVRQRILMEVETGLWAQLLAGRDDSLIDEGESDD